MIYGSVCSGIEAATVAWHGLGWEPAFFSEIEPFPKAVLAHHYPSVPDLGDFTTIGADRGPVDLLVGGTPCQSFSVAGLRGGMADARGNLALEFLRLAARLDARWILWENVPGVLSSNGGRDFGALLGGLAELGYGFAYRILDAQHFGLAQRRRRVFVVGHAGGLWQRAAAVLFERACLRGDPAPSRKAREGSSGGAAGRARGGLFANTGKGWWNDDCGLAQTLRADGGDVGGGTESLVVPAQVGVPDPAYTLCGGPRGNQFGTGRDAQDTFVVPFDTTQITHPANRSAPAPAPGDPSHPLAAGAHPPAIAFSVKDYGADAGPISPTLRSGNFDKSHANGGVMPAIAFHVTQDPISSSGATPALGCGNALGCGTLGVATPIQDGRGLEKAQNGIGIGEPGGPAFTLDTTGAQAVHAAMAVRRLTPRECEALQGFPPDYTAIPYGSAIRPEKITEDWIKYLMRGGRISREEVARIAADGPRYRALGNSMAVPVMAWIGRRIQMVEDAINAASEAA